MNKQCPNCHAETLEESKFCTECGFSFEKGSSDVEVTTATVNGGANPINIEIDFSKVSPVVQGYWQYFLTTLFAPSQSQQSVVSSTGWMQYIVLILLNSFSAIVLSKKVYSAASGFSIFLTAIIFQALLFFLAIVSIYIVNKFIKKSADTMTKVSLNFARLLSPNVILSVLILLSSLLGAYKLLAFLLYLTFALYALVFNIYLFTSENRSTIDSLYLTIIGNAIFAIFLYTATRLFLDIFFAELISMFVNLFYQELDTMLFNQLFY